MALRRRNQRNSVLFAVAALCFFSSCAGKKTESQEPDIGPVVAVQGTMDSDHGQAGGLETVYFEYRSAQLSDEQKVVLQKNLRILRENPQWMIQIEGHCDQRGSESRNYLLGQSRADGVLKALGALGISPRRMNTISYGKNRPIRLDQTEAAFAKNRRVNFVLLQ